MLTWTSREMTSLSRFFEKKGGGAARASQGDVGLDRQTMGKNRERVRFSPRPGRRDRPGEGRTCRTRHAARRDGFPDSLRGEISSCGASWRGARMRARRCGSATRLGAGRCGVARRRRRNAPPLRTSRAGPVRTPCAEFPPPLCLRFQRVINHLCCL